MRWPSPIAGPGILTREFHVDLRALLRPVKEHPELVIVGLGVLLRLIQYLQNRAMWLDEMMLKGNLVGIPVLDFSAPLESDQLAPFGFVIVQRVLATFVGQRGTMSSLLAAGERDRGDVRVRAPGVPRAAAEGGPDRPGALRDVG